MLTEMLTEPPDRPDPPLLTVRQVALRLGVSTKTAYRLTAREKLPCVRISNAIRVRPEDLAAYIG